MNDIFENQNEVIDNIRDSAKNLGADIGEAKSQVVAVAKRNCKKCWGKGWLTYSFPGNRGSDEQSIFYCSCVKFK